MKNVFKRAVVLALSAVTAMSFAGCSGTENGGSGSANSGNSGGAGGNGGSGTIIIGQIGPLTGNTASYGIAVKNGAQLAVDEINAAGGVNGLTLELKSQDDENDPEKSINAYNTLKDEGMQILVGTVTSIPCEAVSKEAAKDNMLLITPSGSSINCISAGDNCFRVCFTDPTQGALAADYISENFDAKKVGIIYNSSDTYSTGIVEGFESEAANVGLEVVDKEAFTNTTNTDFSVQIQKIADSGAEILFLPFYYQEASLVLQQAEGVLDIPVIGGDGLDGLADPAILGDKLGVADGVLVMTPFAASSPDPKSKTFTAAYEAAFNETPIQFAADGYDAVYAIKAALEKAGVTDASMSASDLCDVLKVAMTQIELDGVTGKITWGADGEPTKVPQVMKISVNGDTAEYVNP